MLSNASIITRTILVIISIIAFVGVCYPLGYLFELFTELQNNLFLFWMGGFAMFMILLAPILLFIAVVIGIINVIKYINPNAFEE